MCTCTAMETVGKQSAFPTNQYIYCHVFEYTLLFDLKEYLQALHDRYEEWLGNEKHHSWHGNTPVLVGQRLIHTCTSLYIPWNTSGHSEIRII